MAKIIFIFLIILFGTTKAGFNFKTAKCLFSILVEGLGNHEQGLTNVAQSKYVTDFNKLLSDDPNVYEVAFQQMNDIRFMMDLNDILLNYSSLSDDLKDKILKCNVNKKYLFKRCEETYGVGMCVKDGETKKQINNPVSINVKCPTNAPEPYNSNFCYQSCPKGFTEMGDRCKKNEAKILKAYSTEAACVGDLNSGVKCDSYVNGSLWTKQCPEYFVKSFHILCLPLCPRGYIDDKNYCVKTLKIQLPNPIVFNFNDLYE